MKIIVISCILLLIFSCKKSVTLEYTPPEIVSGNTGIDLIENSGAEQTVYIIEATANVEIASYFIGGDDADLLTLNNNTVSLDANPDFEVKSSYSFEVTVSDAEGDISEIQGVSFSIIDVDETPQFVLNFCENGFAGEYPCNNYDLIGHIDLNTLGANS
ncbi:MAG: regulator, partial [Flavobacterium sp.]|nr:regulator [Flavobacterium sp.]